VMITRVSGPAGQRRIRIEIDSARIADTIRRTQAGDW
jgi:hypothetical protein